MGEAEAVGFAWYASLARYRLQGVRFLKRLGGVISGPGARKGDAVAGFYFWTPVWVFELS